MYIEVSLESMTSKQSKQSAHKINDTNIMYLMDIWWQGLLEADATSTTHADVVEPRSLATLYLPAHVTCYNLERWEGLERCSVSCR